MRQNKLKVLKQKSKISFFGYMMWLYFNKHINYKMGVLSGIVMGSIVYAINIEHGFWPAFASFWKQFIFNLFMAGFNTRSCEKLAKSISSQWVSVFMATVIPTLQAFLILFAIHYFGKTPKPLASTLWQAVGNLFFFLTMALIYRNIIQIKNSNFYKIAKVFRLRVVRHSKRLKKIRNSKKTAS